jgi:hypothetical protein
MKNLLPLLACFVALIACNNRNSANKVNETNSTENMEVVSNEQTTPIVADTIDSDTTEEKRGESLNDIRFAGWGKAEWVDNEYIRTVRRYLTHTTMERLKMLTLTSTKIAYKVNS